MKKEYTFLIVYFYIHQGNWGFGQHEIISSQENLWEKSDDIKETMELIKKHAAKDSVVIVNIIKIGK